jgi:hypothetical protein
MADDEYYDDQTMRFTDDGLSDDGKRELRNIDDWMHYELSKYMLRHARDYNFSPTQTQKFKEYVLNFVRKRRSIIYANPRFQFVQHVAGTVNRPVNHFISNLAQQDAWVDIQALELDDAADGGSVLTQLRQRLRTHAEEVANSRSDALDPDDLVSLLEDLEISGVLRYTPQLAQARDKVLVDLSLKQGGDRWTNGEDMGFMKLIKEKKVLVKLAELVGYQVLLFDQLAPRRAYKEIDYGRIGSKRDAAWTALMVLLGMLGRGSGFTGRKDMRGFATGFLSVGANFKSW